MLKSNRNTSDTSCCSTKLKECLPLILNVIIITVLNKLLSGDTVGKLGVGHISDVCDL